MHSFLTTCSFSKKKKKQDTKSHSIIHIRNYTLQKAIIHAEVTNYLGFISLQKGARRTIDTTKNSYWHPILHFIARLHTEVCTRLVASWIATRRVSREHRLFNCNAWLVFTPSRGEKKKKKGRRAEEVYDVVLPLHSNEERRQNREKMSFCRGFEQFLPALTQFFAFFLPASFRLKVFLGLSVLNDTKRVDIGRDLYSRCNVNFCWNEILLYIFLPWYIEYIVLSILFHVNLYQFLPETRTLREEFEFRIGMFSEWIVLVYYIPTC